jgi:uncharacterized protein
MKILQKICFVLLMGIFSSVYGGDCWDKVPDVANCRVKAEQGDVGAQFNLGFLYSIGKGVPQNYKEAVKWWRKSAEQGDADAQFGLGSMYFKGTGVLQDYVMAHIYWNIAAVSGHETAINNRGIVENKMTSSQLAEAQKLAREWMRKHQ